LFFYPFRIIENDQGKGGQRRFFFLFFFGGGKGGHFVGFPENILSHSYFHLDPDIKGLP